MSVRWSSVESAALEAASTVESLNPPEQQRVVRLSVDLLEDKFNEEDFVAFANELQVKPNKLQKLCLAIGSVLWHCTKILPRDQTALPAFLQEQGASENLANLLSSTFVENRRRLVAMRKPLGLDTLSFAGLSWRLDIELSKRVLNTTAKPAFQLRLNLKNDVVPNAPPQSLPMECDYSTLRRMQDELQRAIEEYNGVHSQRISRYIA